MIKLGSEENNDVRSTRHMCVNPRRRRDGIRNRAPIASMPHEGADDGNRRADRGA